MFFKRKNKQPPTNKIVGGSDFVVTDPKQQIEDDIYSALEVQNLFLKNGCDLQRHIHNNCRDLLVDSERIFVSFRFDWKTYESDIVLTGRTYDLGGNVDKSVEKLLRTPQIPLNSHDLQYTEDSLKYIDTYLGGEKFAGEEALWENDKPFWAMNYMGRVTGDGFSGDFLKEAMSHVSEDLPFRDPEHYESGGYT
jgi:hypothetical protein